MEHDLRPSGEIGRVRAGDVCAAAIKLGVGADEVRMLLAQIAQEPLPSARTEVQREDGGSAGSGRGDLLGDDPDPGRCR